MNRLQLLALVPAAFVLLLGPSALGQDNPSDDEAMKVARQEGERHAAAYNAHDAAAVAALFAPDADQVPIRGDQVQRRKGRAAIQKNLAEAFSKSPNLKIKFTPESARMVTREVHVADGIWEVTGSSTTGPTKGRYTVIRKMTDGRWQIVRSQTFSPQSSAAE